MREIYEKIVTEEINKSKEYLKTVNLENLWQEFKNVIKTAATKTGQTGEQIKRSVHRGGILK